MRRLPKSLFLLEKVLSFRMIRMRQRVGVCCLWSVKTGKSIKRDPWFYLTQSRDSNGELSLFEVNIVYQSFPIVLFTEVSFLPRESFVECAGESVFVVFEGSLPGSLRLVLFDRISWFKRWNYLTIQEKNTKKNLPCSTDFSSRPNWWMLKANGWSSCLNGCTVLPNVWPSRSNKSMIVFTKRVTKSYERMSVFTKRVSKSFERLDVSTERVIKPCERMQTFFERMTQVVRTDVNCLRTASKRLVNRIPFENGKPLVYVFPWKVTNA